MYNYNISPTYDVEIFEGVCSKIEKTISKLSKENILIDVDASVIQIYYKNKAKIKVICDIEVDAVWIESEVALPFFADI